MEGLDDIDDGEDAVDGVRVAADTDGDDGAFEDHQGAVEGNGDSNTDTSDDEEAVDEVAFDVDSDDDIDFEPSSTPRKAGLAPPKKSPLPASVKHKRTRYGRNLTDHRASNSKGSIRLSLFGPSAADQEPAFQAAYRWRREPILPSRKADQSGSGGYHRSFFQSIADRKREIKNDWRWYDDGGGRDRLRIRQRFRSIDSTQAASFFRGSKASLSLVAGPIDAQLCHQLPLHSTLPIKQPFHEDQSTERGRGARSGWYMNVGGRVHTLTWAPNQESSQFLAVSMLSHGGGIPQNAPNAAFRQQTPTKSAIQIWEVEADDKSYMHGGKAPRLRSIICTEFGEIRALTWCPTPRKFEAQSESGRQLGLLAGVWEDGSIRVLDISLASDTGTTQYVYVEQTAFASRPPNTVFSCVTWLSSHALAAGTATGSVAIFDLSASLQDGTASTNADPIFFSILQSTYITGIQSCYPSRPHMLMTSSMSGLVSLTDMGRVSTYPGFHPGNTVYSSRQRIGRSQVIWHDWSQMTLSVDDNNTMHGLPIRRIFGSLGLSKFQSPTLALAVSECHPFIAAAGVGGEVTFTNFLQRTSTLKGRITNLKWFRHTWRRPGTAMATIPTTDTSVAESPAAVSVDGRDIVAAASDHPESTAGRHEQDEETTDVNDQCRLGDPDLAKYDTEMVQIVEGFRAENVILAKPAADAKAKNGEIEDHYTTIFEPQTAVTALTWNPNLHVGGWIAAGMASGLVRIEDVGTGT